MPASVNGIVGLRPTWGRVSRYGMLPFCWSMDTGGPMTRTVEDTALVMNAIAGYDHNDPQTSKLPVPDYAASLTGNLNGVRIGVIKEFVQKEVVHQDVLSAVSAAATRLEEIGASVEEVSLPRVNDVAIVAAAISESDGAFVHREWLRTRPGDYGQNTRRRLIAGSLIPAQIVHKAARIRTRFRQEWQGLSERFDALISPTSPNPPGKIEHVDGVASREEAERRFGHRNSATFPAAFLGLPALSVPCGFSSDGLPVGLQIITDRFEDGLALRIGHAYQESTEWHTMRPDV
jgi:aspartyl-tRNA(Asn)/glutamyl-tRNA(Gln) amidotransferase subunit A